MLLTRSHHVSTACSLQITDKFDAPLLLAPDVVTKDNIRQTIIKDGFQNLETIEKSLPKEKWPQEIRIVLLPSRLFQTPERSIRIYQFEACIPRFMASPDNLGLRLAARLRMDQPDALAQRQVRSHHRHAAGMTHVHGDGVRAFLRSTLLPLHQELHSGDDALVASKSFPTFFYSPV